MSDAAAGGAHRVHRVHRVLGAAAVAVAALLAGSSAWSAAGGGGRAPASLHTTTVAASNVSANASSFIYTPGSSGVAISGEQFTKGTPGTLSLTVYGQPAADGSPTANLTAQLVNQTASTVHFAGGPHVAVTVAHDSQAAAVTLSETAPTDLAPGDEVTLQGSIALGGPGTYTVSASLAG
ncbi:MAG TPA: hypothetical protein VFW71_01205 [Actinomycetota bacterium]|nr:hypothetical protein [Actinomycetota bacterium]